MIVIAINLDELHMQSNIARAHSDNIHVRLRVAGVSLHVKTQVQVPTYTCYGVRAPYNGAR